MRESRYPVFIYSQRFPSNCAFPEYYAFMPRKTLGISEDIPRLRGVGKRTRRSKIPVALT